MRIQHNIMAMNAYRNYNNNVSAMKKNLEKLSSGYKINRAGDDAAGLAISEKMRAQITGLETAQKNAKDGISLVQTAEGALTEVHDMLNRMVTLATQSANGTYDNETDRYQLQKELDQLRSEIDRIADSANFNGIKLLDGSMEADTVKCEITGKSDLEILAGPGTTVLSSAGTSTIIHTDASAGVKTKFYVELGDLAFTTNAGSKGGDSGIIVGGVDITVQLTANQRTTGEDLAKLFDGKEVKIDGVSYAVSHEGTKVVFEMTDKSLAKATMAASFTGNFNVAVKLGDKVKQECTTGLASDTITEGGPIDNGTCANTKLKSVLQDSDIVDKFAITVGNTSYVFAATKETLKQLQSSGDKNIVAVDITDIVDADGTLDNNKVTHGSALSEALSRLSVAAKDNEMFTVGVTSDYKLTFREKVGYSGDADLTTAKGIQAQIQKGTFNVSTIRASNGTGMGLTLQIGDTAESFNQLKVSVKDCHVNSIGAGAGKTIADISIADQASAANAVDVIKSAINYISDVRGTLGATQNRLDHTINNLSVMTENIQDAESTIRDTDVAEEMMAYTKNNILIQSAQAMLAQANQVPQGVLQLLQ